MKKILLPLLCLAALAACTKSEVQYEAPSEISFVSVSKMATKAAVDGTNYPEKLNMYVFANAGLDTDADGMVELTECTEAYFSNAEFEHGDNDATGVFGGVIPYYWPNVKSLYFAGVSKSGNINATTDGSVPTMDFSTNTLTIEDYKPLTGTTTAGDNDLMYFTATGPHKKPTTSNSAVDVTMEHACSWITVKVAGNENSIETGMAIKDLTIKNLSTSGKVVICPTATTKVDWTESTDKTGTFNLHSNADENSKGTNGTLLTTKYVDLLKSTNAIVVPQAPATLFVTYEYISQPANGTQAAIVVEETKDIKLEYNGTAEWQPGYHYTYQLLITAEEILLKPIATDWVEYDADSATTGVDPVNVEI